MNLEATKTCQNCRSAFIIEDEDLQFYKKIEVPPPTFCPECRLKRRMLWRNERLLHKRKSSLSGEEMISQFSDVAPFPVYSPKEYFSRMWTPPELEYSSERSFFDQFHELLGKTPQCALLTDLESLEHGSIYQNGASRNKQCYMVSASGDNEDCMYSNNLDYSKFSLDSLWCRRVEFSYDNIDSLDSNKLFFSQECEQCVDCWFSYNCKNCINCFGCVGLRNKSYCLWNTQLSKEEYEKEIKTILADLIPEKISYFRSKLEQLTLLFPYKYMHIDFVSSATCTGDYIVNSKNIFRGFTIHESQDSRYCSKLIAGKECFDMTDWGDPAELCYECITVGKSAYKVLFSNNCWPECREISYCDSCSNSHHLFGCVGLKDASFCILNKKYSEDEYYKITGNIIKDMTRRGEYGEFFPKELSPFSYNEAIVQEYFPCNKEEAESRGYMWAIPEERDYKVTKKPEDLPGNIKDVDGGILNEVIECAHVGKCNHGCSTAFKIIKEELAFYKRFGLPIPRLCFNCRHGERFAKRNPMKLWHRKCMCGQLKTEDKKQKMYQNTAIHKHGDKPCLNEFETSYSPDRKEIVYCEQCYQAEVI